MAKKSFENAEKLKYLGTALTQHTYLQEKIKLGHRFLQLSPESFMFMFDI